MELNREQIIKVLEYCTSGGSCNKCPYDDNPRLSYEGCLAKKMTNALALIKELTEENERLHASCTELTQECKKWQGRVKIECEYTKAATVREMQKSVTSFFEADDIVRYNEVDADFINEQINEIANKLLEEK